MYIEGVFAGEPAACSLPPAAVYIGTGPRDPAPLWLLEYTPENQRHLENHIRKAERLPTLSETCPSLPKYHFTLTKSAQFYVCLDPLPEIKLETGLLTEAALISAFERVVQDWKVLGLHVRAS